MEHKLLATPRGQVHYWTSPGPGDTALVFTHGLTADHTMYERQIRCFEGRYPLLVWDVPLHGRSRPYRNFSFRHAAEDLAAILDREGMTRTVQIGMSMGGYPAQMFAHLFPQRTRGLVAIDTTPFGLSYYSKSDLFWLRHTEGIARCFPAGLLRWSMARSVARTDWSTARMAEMLAPLSRADIACQMGVAYGAFTRENMDMELSCPVLILLGDHDRTGKVAQYSRAWAARTGYPLHIIQNAAHFSNGDNPEQVNREIADFLRAL